MLYYIHYAQLFALMASVYALRQFFGKQCGAAFRTIGLVIVVAFHVSMLHLTVSPLVYLWFWMVMWHFHVHLEVAFYTIPETRRATIDEAWHATNQTLATFYLWYHGLQYQYYGALMLLYYVFLYIGCTYSEMRPVYYLGSPMEALFIMSLRPLPSLPSVLVPLCVQMGVTHMITYDNKPGRAFLRANVAGCTFLSEFFILYMVENNLY
jgi:hypothetical protein